MFLLPVVLFSQTLSAQCLTASFGQYPFNTIGVNCTGSPQDITTDGYGGEYSRIIVTSGVSYTFTSSISTDYITIGTADGATALAFGTTPVVWTSTISGEVRFYTHASSACGDNTSFRTRAVTCAAPPCPPPYSVSAGSVTDSGAIITWSGTGNFILEYGPAGFAPGTGATAGAGTLISPANSGQAVTGLSPNTNYDVYIRNDCSNSSNGFSTNSAASFTTHGPPPANDLICDAITLVIDGASDCQNTADATSLNDPTNACSSPNNTVWYKFTTTTSGQKSITMANPATGSALDAWVFLYSVTGGCNTPTYTQVPFPDGCQAGSNGNNGSTHTFLTGALAAGTEYYLLIDGVSGDAGQYCISIATPPPPPSCATLIAPADATTNLDIYPTAPTFSWDAVTGATSYKLFIGSSAATASSVATVTSTSTTYGQLDFNTTYYWYVVPVGAGGDAMDCSANAISFTTEMSPPAPPNDSCAYAITIPVDSGFAVHATVGTTMFATTESGFGNPSCAGSISNDVWYTFTVPASGNVTVQTSAMNTTASDLVLEVYSGACGSLTLIDCNDDDNPDPAPSSGHPRISLMGQTPGAVLHARVMPYSSNYYGEFAIEAWDPTALPAISPGGDCIASPSVDISTSNGNLYRWIPIVDNSGKIIAELYPDGNALGIVSTSVFVNTGAVRQSNGVYYLDRNLTITPTTQPSSDVKVRTYFQNSELAALQALDPSVTPANINFSKNNDGCQGTVMGTTDQFAQTANATYNTAGGWVQFETPSFSSIFLRGGSTPLPIKLEKINAVNVGSQNKIVWTTAHEDKGEYFELERSADGRTFNYLSKTEGKGNATTYTYWDASPIIGTSYYRLKIVDKGSKSSYSPIVSAIRSATNTFEVKGLPNPVSHTLKVMINGGHGDAIVTLTDVTGKTLFTYKVTGTEVAIDMETLAQGIYLVKYQDVSNTQTIRVSKQ